MATREVTPQSVEAVITDALEKVGAEREEISREATFEQLDVDSLDLVEVAQTIEEEFGVEIKGEDAGKLENVGDAIDLVLQRAPS